MSDPISDTYTFPASRYQRQTSCRWIDTMAQDIRSLSVTKVHLPIVLLIAIIGPLSGGLVTLTWTAATKSATLDTLKGQVDGMSKDIETLKSQSAAQTAQIQAISNQLSDIREQLQRNK